MCLLHNAHYILLFTCMYMEEMDAMSPAGNHKDAFQERTQGTCPGPDQVMFMVLDQSLTFKLGHFLYMQQDNGTIDKERAEILVAFSPIVLKAKKRWNSLKLSPLIHPSLILVSKGQSRKTNLVVQTLHSLFPGHLYFPFCLRVS